MCERVIVRARVCVQGPPSSCAQLLQLVSLTPAHPPFPALEHFASRTAIPSFVTPNVISVVSGLSFIPIVMLMRLDHPAAFELVCSACGAASDAGCESTNCLTPVHHTTGLRPGHSSRCSRPPGRCSGARQCPQGWCGVVLVCHMSYCCSCSQRLFPRSFHLLSPSTISLLPIEQQTPWLGPGRGARQQLWGVSRCADGQSLPH